MLDFKEIEKYFPLNESRLDRAVLVEYLQYKILEILFESKFGEKLVFMGGTSARIIYGNDRFSEDLDLDGYALKKDDFGLMIKNLALNLKREAFEVEYRNVYKGVFRCYLKFLNLLQKFNLTDYETEKILIQLDINQKKGKVKFETRIINKFDVFAEIRVYPIDMLLSQKIIALLNRKRPKGRDIYDIVFLFSKTQPEWNLLKKEIGIEGKSELKEKFEIFCEKNDLKKLARDVEPFLIKSKKIIQVEKFRDWVKTSYSLVAAKISSIVVNPEAILSKPS